MGQRTYLSATEELKSMMELPEIKQGLGSGGNSSLRELYGTEGFG